MIDDYLERPAERSEYERRGTRTDIPYAHNDDIIEPQRPDVVDAPQTYQGKKAVVRSYNIIWFFVSIIVALLTFRFVFELLGANPLNAFVQFIYTLSYPFAGPFQTIFGITSVARSTFDWSVLVAIVVYLLIGYALVQLLRIIRPMTPEDVNHRIRTV